jgi:hypothetical protein
MTCIVTTIRLGYRKDVFEYDFGNDMPSKFAFIQSIRLYRLDDHSPTALPARFINQTYLPENAVVSPGTTIVWFSGDNAHDHFINLNNARNNASIFSSGAFAFNAVTKPVKLNNTGDFMYSDHENAKSKEVGINGYVMTGKIRVINQPSSSNSGSITAAATTTTATNSTVTNSTATKLDTVGARTKNLTIIIISF